ncbi:MAG: ABC transporter ATP-binding protein [Actinomycetota bacterium]
MSFDLFHGECVVIIGESGSGKTATVSSILRLLPASTARVAADSIRLEGTDIQDVSDSEMQTIRARKIGMIFQDPTAALDPSMRIGDQLWEVLRVHEGMDRKAAKERAVSLLRSVDIPEPESRYRSYAHELSGGMRQRAMIALAIALDPAMLIADEPTTALDTTVQAQILDLLDEKRDAGMALLFVTHDLGVAARIADRLLVMYAGGVVEEGPGVEVLQHPGHPYTAGLLACTPDPLRRSTGLRPIPGSPPVLDQLPVGCPFADRCPHAEDICETEAPPRVELSIGHWSRCHFPERVR